MIRNFDYLYVDSIWILLEKYTQFLFLGFISIR